MAKLGWMQFYPRDWVSDPKLARCSVTTRGIWIELLSAMFIEGESSIVGDVWSLAAVARCEVTDITDRLIPDVTLHKFADVTECNGTYTITSRRFEREEKAREKLRQRVQRHRSKGSNQSENSTCNADVTSKRNVDVSQTPSDSDSVSISNSSSPKTKNPDRSRPWPDDLVLTKEMREYAIAHGIANPEREFERWKAYCLSHGKKYSNWQQTWTTWVLNAPDFAGKARASPETTMERIKRVSKELGNGKAENSRNNSDARSGVLELEPQRRDPEIVGDDPGSHRR